MYKIEQKYQLDEDWLTRHRIKLVEARNDFAVYQFEDKTFRVAGPLHLPAEDENPYLLFLLNDRGEQIGSVEARGEDDSERLKSGLLAIISKN